MNRSRTEYTFFSLSFFIHSLYFIEACIYIPAFLSFYFKLCCGWDVWISKGIFQVRLEGSGEGEVLESYRFFGAREY